MQLPRTTWLVLLLLIIGVALYWFRPGGVEGARPEPVAATGRGFDYSQLDEVLAKAVAKDGAVDYAALRKDRASLDRFLGQLRATSPGNAGHRFKSSADRLAYYLNAYNALMLAAVLDHCPLDNVQTVYVAGGLFWRVSYLLGETPTTLSDLEGKIRGVMGADPAARLGLVKAAKGSPALPTKAYRGDTVHEQLAAHAKVILELPQIMRQEGDTVHLSKIFEWYHQDFGQAPLKWIERMAPGLLKGTPKTVDYLPFNWALNGHCP